MWLATVASNNTADTLWGETPSRNNALLIFGYGQTTGVPYPGDDSTGYWEPVLQTNSGMSVGYRYVSLWGDSNGSAVTNYWDQYDAGFAISAVDGGVQLDSLTPGYDGFFVTAPGGTFLTLGGFFHASSSSSADSMRFSTHRISYGGSPSAIPAPTTVTGLEVSLQLLLSQFHLGYGWLDMKKYPDVPDGYFSIPTGSQIIPFRDSQWGIIMTNPTATFTPYFVQDGMNVTIYDANAISAVSSGYNVTIVESFDSTTMVGVGYNGTNTALFSITRSGSTISVNGPQVTIPGSSSVAFIDSSRFVMVTRASSVSTFRFFSLSGGTITLASTGSPTFGGDWTGMFHATSQYVFVIVCGFFGCQVATLTYNFSSGAMTDINQTDISFTFITFALEGQPDWGAYTQNGNRFIQYHFDGTTLHVSNTSGASNAYRQQHQILDAGRYPTPSVSPVLERGYLVIWDWIAGDVDQIPYNYLNGPWDVGQMGVPSVSANFAWHTGTLGAFAVTKEDYTYPAFATWLIPVDWSTLI